MTSPSQRIARGAQKPVLPSRDRPFQDRAAGTYFGIPLGDLGWFTTLLMSFAAGFIAFFAATFLAILTILVLNTANHGALDYALSYRRVGLPAGLLVLSAALVFLGRLWILRQLRRA